jgi:hypothetical protein
MDIVDNRSDQTAIIIEPGGPHNKFECSYISGGVIIIDE